MPCVRFKNYQLKFPCSSVRKTIESSNIFSQNLTAEMIGQGSV